MQFGSEPGRAVRVMLAESLHDVLEFSRELCSLERLLVEEFPQAGVPYVLGCGAETFLGAAAGFDEFLQYGNVILLFLFQKPSQLVLSREMAVRNAGFAK